MHKKEASCLVSCYQSNTYSTFLKLNQIHLKVTTMGRFTTAPLTNDITNSNFHNNLKLLFKTQLVFFVFRGVQLTLHLSCMGKTPVFYPFVSSTWYSKPAKVFQSPFKREAWCSSQ